MPDILDIIDKNATPEEQMDSIRKNFTMVSKTNLKAGAYGLVVINTKTAQTISTASYVALTQFSGSFVSSGGLVGFLGSIVVDCTNVLTTMALFIDDVETAWAVQTNTSGVAVHVPFQYWGNLNAGSHKFQIKAKVSSGNAVIGYYSSANAGSNFSIIEFLRG